MRLIFRIKLLIFLILNKTYQLLIKCLQDVWAHSDGNENNYKNNPLGGGKDEVNLLIF